MSKNSDIASPDPDGLSAGSVLWQDLVPGTLIRRYKRFIADVRLSDGTTVSAHCPNSGSMRGCSEPGRAVYLSRSPGKHRRLAYTWELIDMPDSLVCINTLCANRLARRSVEAGLIPELSSYDSVRPEVRYGANSRIDLLLESADRPRCYVEVKSSTLVEAGAARFPDAVTSRGFKHLVELQGQVRAGHRSVLLFLVQRMDADRFRPADHIDPEYGKELRRAASNGLEILCYDVRVSPAGMALNRSLPVHLQTDPDLHLTAD